MFLLADKTGNIPIDGYWEYLTEIAETRLKIPKITK